MSIPEFISSQPAERQKLLSQLHKSILAADKSLTSAIEPMMGKEMIIYKCNGTFKYGLASVQKHMSLHAMPLYMSPDLHAKYVKLLPQAAFQKGCINFKDEKEISAKIVSQLITDGQKFNLQEARASLSKSKK